MGDAKILYNSNPGTIHQNTDYKTINWTFLGADDPSCEANDTLNANRSIIHSYATDVCTLFLNASVGSDLIYCK